MKSLSILSKMIGPTYRIFLFLLIFFGSYSILFADSIKIKLINKTNSKDSIVESVKLIQLSEGMKTIAELEKVKGEVEFPNIVMGNAPLLAQATYLGVNYNKIIPPVPDISSKIQEIFIYEPSTDKKILDIGSLIQISREETLYRVYKIFLISNKSNPPVSYNSKEGLEFYIPESAQDVYATLKQEGSSMGIPLQLEDSKLGKKFSRAILPGNCELQVSFAIPITNNSAIWKDMQTLDASNNFRHIFLKPGDIKLSIQGAVESSKLEKELPEGYNAYKVTYPKNSPITLQLEGGSVLSNKASHKEERVIRNGTIFTSTLKNIYGLVAVLVILFSFSYIFVYKKLGSN